MKKIILVIAAFFALTAFAQEQISDLVVRKYIANPSFRTEDEENLYVWFTRTWLSGEYYDVSLAVIPKSGGAGREILVKRPSKSKNQFFNLLACYEDDQNLISVYSYYTESTYNICWNTLPKNTEKFLWNPQTVLSVPFDKQITFNAVGVTSPDKRKAGVAIFQMQFNTTNLQGAHMLSFDENGLQWDHPIDFDFENRTLQILDMIIGNDADLYAALISFNKKEEGKEEVYENETLHLYQFGQYGEQNVVEEAVDFGHISNGKLLLTSSNRLSLGGYYAPNSTAKETGCFIASTVFPNPKQIDLSRQEFPTSYYTYKHSATKQPAEEFNAHTIGFFEFSDNSLVLLGEMQAQHKSVELQTAGGPILVHFANKACELGDFKTINKNQCIVGRSASPTGLRTRMFSYYAMMYQDNIHIFFHDNIQNYNGETNKHTFIAERVFGVGLNYDEVCAAHCTINSRQEISAPEMLMDYQQHKSYMIAPLFITPDAIVLCRSDKVSNRISRLKHQF